MPESVDHPAHYGGEDNPYEAIKVIEAWRLGFCLGNTLKYISRAGKKDPKAVLQDLKKAAWYLNREISKAELAQTPRKFPISDPKIIADARRIVDAQKVKGKWIYVVYKEPGDIFTQKQAGIYATENDPISTVINCAKIQMKLEGEYAFMLEHTSTKYPISVSSSLPMAPVFTYLEDGYEIKLVKVHA